MDQQELAQLAEVMKEAKATLEQVVDDAHAGGLRNGRADKAEAVQAEHEATLADMDALHIHWMNANPNRKLESFHYVRSRMDAKYEARTNPPPDRVTVEMDTDFYRKMVLARSPWLAHMTLVGPPSEPEKSEEK